MRSRFALLLEVGPEKSPVYGLVGYPLWKRWNKNGTASEVSDASLKRIRKADFALAASRLPGLDSAIERQREIAGFYSRTLELDAGMLCAESPEAYYNRYYYPITFPSNEHRDRIAAILHRAGIDSIKYLDDVVGQLVANMDIRRIVRKRSASRGRCLLSLVITA